MTEEEQPLEVDKEALAAEHFLIGIVGTNSTAKALEYSFGQVDRNSIMVVDKINNHIEDLIEFEPNIVFLCNEVERNENGIVDAAELEDYILRMPGTGFVIKTPLPTAIVERICWKNIKNVYEPDLSFFPGGLNEQAQIRAKLSQPVVVMGGHPQSTMAVQEIYYRFSTIDRGRAIHVSPTEASFIEQAMGSLIVVQEIFYTQLYEAVKDHGGSWHMISSGINTDPRVGKTARIPNIDGTYGCESEQAINALKSLKSFSDRFTFLENCDIMNDRYRERD